MDQLMDCFATEHLEKGHCTSRFQSTPDDAI
jgi:hypothetical protein